MRGCGLPGRPQGPERAPLRGWTGRPLSCEGAHFRPPPHPSWPSVWGLRAPDPRKELGVPGLLVAGPGLTERRAGTAWDGPCPSFILSLRRAGWGPAAVCWLLALGCDRFPPHRRMARVHTGGVTCMARWLGLGPWRFSQADERVSGPRPSAHSGLGHSTTRLLGSPGGASPEARCPGHLLSPWPGPGTMDSTAPPPSSSSGPLGAFSVPPGTSFLTEELGRRAWENQRASSPPETECGEIYQALFAKIQGYFWGAFLSPPCLLALEGAREFLQGRGLGVANKEEGRAGRTCRVAASFP